MPYRTMKAFFKQLLTSASFDKVFPNLNFLNFLQKTLYSGGKSVFLRNNVSSQAFDSNFATFNDNEKN